MPETPQEPRHKFSALTTLAAVLATFLLAAAAYVCWQAAHILFPQNVYETALPITISDTIEADGVLLFDETCISGSGNLGYLVSDGERVSAGTAVAELYTDANQAVLRQQLTQLTSQIDLLQRSQNTAATQLDGLLKERSGALYDLLDALDTAHHRRYRRLCGSDCVACPAGTDRAGTAGQPHPDRRPHYRLLCPSCQQRTAECRCCGHSGAEPGAA